eukprot:4988449-Prymnesium_polylepis.2
MCSRGSGAARFIPSKTNCSKVSPASLQANGLNTSVSAGVQSDTGTARNGASAIRPNTRIHAEKVSPLAPWNASAGSTVLAIAVPRPSKVNTWPDALPAIVVLAVDARADWSATSQNDNIVASRALLLSRSLALIVLLVTNGDRTTD